jgi:hypothetical protein
MLVFVEWLLVSTTDCVELLPTATGLKERLLGLADNRSLATPVPASGSNKLEFEALLLNVASPPIHPTAVGVKVTSNVTLCPAVSVTGKVNPLTLNSAPLRLIEETETLLFPTFIKVIS